jgi:hypothetical protein
LDGSTATRVYLVFKNINSVVSVWNNSSPNAFTASYIPIGEPVTIIAFSLKDGKEYVGTANVTVSANLSTTVQMSEASETEIVALINASIGN